MTMIPQKNCLFLLPPGFEEIEVVSTLDILLRGNVNVCLAAIQEGSKSVKGKHQITLQADTFLEDVFNNEYDALILPGGPGVQTLLDSKKTIELCLRFFDQKKLIAAICAAPLVLHQAGILNNKKYTAHFSVSNILTHIQLSHSVIQDGTIITANGPAAAILFGLNVLSYLKSPNIAEKIASDICFTSFKPIL